MHESLLGIERTRLGWRAMSGIEWGAEVEQMGHQGSF
jgi:hypothetical protein